MARGGWLAGSSQEGSLFLLSKQGCCFAQDQWPFPWPCGKGGLQSEGGESFLRLFGKLLSWAPVPSLVEAPCILWNCSAKERTSPLVVGNSGIEGSSLPRSIFEVNGVLRFGVWRHWLVFCTVLEEWSTDEEGAGFTGWQALYRERLGWAAEFEGPQPRLCTSPLSEVAIIPFGCGQGITWDESAGSLCSWNSCSGSVSLPSCWGNRVPLLLSPLQLCSSSSDSQPWWEFFSVLPGVLGKPCLWNTEGSILSTSTEVRRFEADPLGELCCGADRADDSGNNGECGSWQEAGEQMKVLAPNSVFV